MSFLFIKATQSDIPYLQSLREQTMHEHLKRAGKNMTTEQHMQRVLYRFDLAHIIQHNDIRIGALKYDITSRPVSILQLQIAPPFQNKGYGKQILENIMSTHRKAGVSLSVLKDNPALQLYQRLGFRQTGEDALEYHLIYPPVQNNERIN